MPHLTRRQFALASAASGLRGQPPSRKPRIVLRSSWQTVNIGDIGHTPGVLALLEKHVPEAELILWPVNIGDGVEEMLRARFPRVTITRDVAKIHEADLLLHGSGPYLSAQKDLASWKKATGKPYGVYGITMAPAGDAGLGTMNNRGLDAACKEVLDGASFVYLRDGVSAEVVRKAGVKSPVIEFGPDGAFGCDLRNDAAAAQFMQANGLEAGKFLCCIPRYRLTPYWKVKPNVPFDAAKHARNEAMKEHDNAPLREAIAAVVRRTDLKVVVCPEDATQMELGKTVLVDPLPAEIRAKVVWREKFWLTDEALSLFRQSAGLFGNEMHSPILCIGNGIPAIVCRFAEQTSKGFMWRDIGLGEWLFDLDRDEELPRVAAAVLAMASNPKAAKEKAGRARAFVEKRQRETMAVVRKTVGLRA